MTNLAARVRRYVVRQRLWPRGGRVVAAVSGGGDSVALLRLLGELAASGDLVLAGVAHLNHQLRPPPTATRRCAGALAADAGVPLDAARVDVAAAARAARCSVEVAARDARYAFFEQARARLGADVVAVAHTRDDQAETVLLRLLRGTGTRGLRGALPRRGAIVRPLLACGRDELRAYLRGLGATWVDDETNADLGILRNRVRHDLLPRLARDYRPSVARILARTADLAHDDDAFLAAAADTAAAGVTSKEERGLLIDRARPAGPAGGARTSGGGDHARGGRRLPGRPARRRRAGAGGLSGQRGGPQPGRRGRRGTFCRGLCLIQ